MRSTVRCISCKPFLDNFPFLKMYDHIAYGLTNIYILKQWLEIWIATKIDSSKWTLQKLYNLKIIYGWCYSTNFIYFRLLLLLLISHMVVTLNTKNFINYIQTIHCQYYSVIISNDIVLLIIFIIFRYRWTMDLCNLCICAVCIISVCVCW